MAIIPVRHIQADANETDFAGNFQVRTIDSLLSDAHMVQPLHRHSYFYILVLLKAAGTHTIDFVEYPVEDHTVFFMRPGQVHELTLERGSTGYLMQFGKDFHHPAQQVGSRIFRKVSSKNHCPVAAERFEKLYSAAGDIFHEFSTREHGYQQAIHNSLSNFFIRLARQSQNPENVANEGGSYLQDRFEELLAMLELHISEHKEVSYYANALNLSNYQLNAVTKTILGKRCSEVINDHILLEAKRHLLATSDQINHIAWLLGYEDVSYFIRFFKKHTGYTPELFRQNFA
nr:helix-turn-helix transcriptional regulator [uncultured Dyadobacter sp.]